MKKIAIILLLSTMVLQSARAESQEVEFECKARVEVDKNQYHDIAMLVVSEYPISAKLITKLTGSTMTTPLDTVYASYNSLKDSFEQTGVKQILDAGKLTPAQIKNISYVFTYKAGNFDDDLAGVLGVIFWDGTAKKELYSGMVFGWAGAHPCQKK